jgi:triphosphoribosyl-dephospho-CoA synthetase
MSARSASPSQECLQETDHEIEGVLLHIKGLIFARALLEQRGASESELAEHAAEIQRERRRLAELVRPGPRPCPPTRSVDLA